MLEHADDLDAQWFFATHKLSHGCESPLVCRDIHISELRRQSQAPEREGV
jgi:hypothetical protein